MHWARGIPANIMCLTFKTIIITIIIVAVYLILNLQCSDTVCRAPAISKGFCRDLRGTAANPSMDGQWQCVSAPVAVVASHLV